MDGNRCVFVIGAPRSGTTWLQRMIESHPDVASVPFELTVFSRYLAPLVKGYELEETALKEGRWRQGLAALYERQEFDEFVRQGIDTVYAKVLSARPEATMLLDKHPGYCHHLHLIERYLPGSRFIHIIRDGREVAVSMISAKRRLGYGAGEIEGASREWRSSVQAAREFGVAIGSRYLEVRYEDLMKDTESVLERVFKHSDVMVGEEELTRIAKEHHISNKQVSRGDTGLNELRSKPDAIWRSRLNLKQRFIMDRIAGELLEELGYAGTGWWSLKPMQRLLVLPYPLYLRAKRSLNALLAIWSRPIFRA